MISDKELTDMQVIKSRDGVFIPKDFCLVSLLNYYQSNSPLKDEEYNAISDFLFHLELDLGICDGTNPKYLKQRVVSKD
ncbi:hypothetical protein [Paenibacillus sp. FSL M7-0420]|uniref:hypothetical protein n=1 Tax=Paenibacillus sp. FSL M7-0420 TaxID=2921609 RepID=UPI0030F7F452